MKRLMWFGICAGLLAIQVGAVGCANSASGSRASGFDGEESPWLRRVEARPSETIFSPLNLPAPTTIRNGAGAPGADYWQQRVDYSIDATLDAGTREVSATATIRYTNNSPDDLDYLWLHLEQNVFRETSVGVAIADYTAIGVDKAEGFGYEIQSVRANGRDLQLDEYDTLGLLHLPAPIRANGDTFTFDIAWRFIIPEHAFRRFGYEPVEQGEIFELAQWFPAVAVYDDMHGWNAMPYLGTGEFYTNFGDYDVRLTVPRSHIVAATGVLQNPHDVYTTEQLQRISTARNSEDTVIIRGADEVSDPASRPAGSGPLTWHFAAENVRTFAWASSDAFIYDGCNEDGIFVQSVYPKEAMPNWSQSSQMMKSAIANYNRMWFRYPYPEATNVNGPEGGMEYPMIVFCGSRDDERGLYSVTAHEIGHNWFPMVVNTDERRHAWMDEGFNTFINYYAWGDWYEGELGRRGNAADFVEEMLEPNRAPMIMYPDHLPARELGDTQYEKPAVGLVMLREHILGPERFDFAFRSYIERWAFKSPRPADFFRTMEDAAGADLAWFWRGWFYETSLLDQAISRVRFEDGEVAVYIDNLEELVMPVILRVEYSDGTVETRKYPVEVWFNTNRYIARWESDQRPSSIVIDPDEAFPDINRRNNDW